ncbi:hepatic lectin-like, partial [Diaphorina citri]|uniref:Hepatic lectin-like n=1 Tax=Diaphorina citri TaxID=121845 RepID=A0A1S3DK55_DIACI
SGGGECSNCIDDSTAASSNRWSMPLLKSGEKRYYLNIFFKFWRLQGLGHEHFWISGTDQAEEGTFFWMATGKPITFTNWNAGEPNNFRYENGEEEHCLELWNRDGKGMKWNDSPCSFETYFVCEL